MHGLPTGFDLLALELRGPVLHVRLARPAKRNAISDPLVAQLRAAFEQVPPGVRAAVLSGEGPHFCAGLDLSELVDRDAGEGLMHSRMWHAAFESIQFGRVPVVAALQGAVVGGGLELAASCHVRVADRTAYFGLPEGQRGLFVGGGGAARIPRLIGVARMADMMLTGRTLDIEQALAWGLVTYVTPEGGALEQAFALAHRIAENAPLSNYAVMHALPRIAQASQAEGLFTESLMAAVAESGVEAKERLRAFLDGRAGKVLRP